MGFQLKSGNKVPAFKMMGSSPLTMPGHGAPENHKHDGDNWTAQEVTKGEDGEVRINNSSGTVGKEGTTTTTPGTNDVTSGDTEVAPGTNQEGSVTGNTGSNSDQMSNEDWAKFLEDHPGWTPPGETDPETDTTPGADETKEPVIETTSDTPDTREDEVLSAGPGKGAVTDSISFAGLKERGKVGKFWDRLTSGGGGSSGGSSDNDNRGKGNKDKVCFDN